MMSILLAEDDKNFGRILMSEIQDNQLHVDLVHDGVSAVLNFMSKPYDFVLLDIRMPRLDGNDALKIIKKINPNIPVITISGNAGIHEREMSVQCGALKCLAKPFSIAHLKEDIRSYILK